MFIIIKTEGNTISVNLQIDNPESREEISRFIVELELIKKELLKEYVKWKQD